MLLRRPPADIDDGASRRSTRRRGPVVSKTPAEFKNVRLRVVSGRRSNEQEGLLTFRQRAVHRPRPDVQRGTGVDAV